MLLDQVQRQYGFENLIGAGPAMQRVFETIQKVSETDLTVLIRGMGDSIDRGAIQLWIVTRAAHHCTHSDRAHPVCSALSALVKTANLEYDWLEARTVDLPPLMLSRDGKTVEIPVERLEWHDSSIDCTQRHHFPP